MNCSRHPMKRKTNPMKHKEIEKISGVYMLSCSDSTLYTGWTNALDERLNAHNTGKGAKYTRSRRPVTLVYWEPCETRSDAMRREAQIKRLTRAQKLALVQSAENHTQEICFK